MNIVVCVKYVPDATADRQFESDNTVDRVGVDGLLSELDEYAVEQALQLKEKAGDDTEVTALCVGPEKAVDAAGGTLSAVIDDLEGNHPGIKERLVDNGDLRRFINIYVNDEDVRFIGGLEAELKDGDQVVVLPAVAGG